ncbi:helix-turn-helix domain-containing protein [uncultured Nevskia sp.]|uniref:helix-turn-helix domain-containing protein n=1 Tax=uncultured Nevskia sp. TaxID=228950 RepID=UPI0025CEA59A|nr:helix-turn-helix domain-containing protein [uncultured Nevskia sp.]
MTAITRSRPMPIVVVVAFDRISPFHLAVPCAVFGEEHPGLTRFEFKVCASEPGPLRTTAGFSLSVDHGLEALDDAGLIIVPSWRDPAERPPQALLDALQAAHARGARIVGLCLGACVLADAGLLAGRRATTHWGYAAELARQHPDIDVDADVLYLDDGLITTTAGTAAGLDCCLHLLRGLCGSEIANKVARRLVVPPHRQGGQAQFIEQPLPTTGADTRLDALINWLHGHLHQPHDLDSLSARALMSRRTFTRRFRERTGMTLIDWLTAERLGLSQRLLETTEHPVEQIAVLAGFGSAVSLRQHFRRALGVSPGAWRASFSGS